MTLTAGRAPSCLVFAAALVANAVAVAAESYYETILRGRKITCTADGLNEYLRGLHPGEDQQRRIRQLVKQLGTPDSFAQREDAMAKLIVLPVMPTVALAEAARGSDPEIRWRATHILDVGKPESEQVLFAAFKVIADKKTSGVAAEVVRAIPLCERSHICVAAQEALSAAARPSDARLLQAALQSDNVNVQVAAIDALRAALGDDAARDLTPLLDDASDTVRLAAASAVVNFGNTQSLAVLADLLGSADPQVRTRSAAALRQLSGKHFGFASYDQLERRREAMEKWKTWIAAEGPTAELRLPLRTSGSGVSYLGGNTLLAYGYKNKVVELDPSGKEVWSYASVNAPWSAEKLANGNVLIAAYQNNRVIEVDPSGKIVWSYDNSNCLTAKLLENGNILIAEISGRKTIEVDRNKRIVWKYESASSCYDAHRLPNGNTFIGLSNAIVEVNPDGDTVWQYDVNGSHGFQPLPNGNVLICDSPRNKVIEVTRGKEIVWELTENYPCDVFRLPDGNTLVTGGSRFVEVTPDKKEVWSVTGNSYGSARR